MTCYELDPDVVRWGLHLIDVCSINDGGSPVTITQYDRDLSQTELIREGYSGTSYLPQTELLREGYTGTSYLPQTELNREDDYYVPSHANVENDEIIAHTLQEELSRIAIAESSGSSHAKEDHQKESVLSQDWLGSSKRHCNFGYERNCEMSVGPSAFLPQIEDESTLDGEVGKRLNQSQMVAVPHVPKINGEIPSVDEATSDHQRLMDRLELYDLVELKVSGDGNCQFRSLSDQIYRTTDHHKFVREEVVIQLKSHPELYKSYVPMAYDEYLRKMRKTGEWGDHVTLQAAADAVGHIKTREEGEYGWSLLGVGQITYIGCLIRSKLIVSDALLVLGCLWLYERKLAGEKKFGLKIFIITSFKDTCYIEILPHMQKSKRTIFLSFWAEVHYNSIYPRGEFPTVETDKKKKKWWWLGSSRWATSPNEV